MKMNDDLLARTRVAGIAQDVVQAGLTMSTVEIAEMTGKQHQDVLRAGRRMLRKLAEAGLIDAAPSSFESSYEERRRSRPCLLLPPREAAVLILGCWR